VLKQLCCTIPFIATLIYYRPIFKNIFQKFLTFYAMFCSRSEDENNINSLEEEDDDSNGGMENDSSATAAFTSINSLAAERPKFKFSELLGEEEDEGKAESVTFNSRQTPPDSFKFFAAVPGSSGT
jgi:hypothetical protein